LNDLLNALLIFIIAWLASRLVRLFFSLVQKKITSRTRNDLDSAILEAIRGPISLYIWVLGLKWALQSLHLGNFGLFTGDPEVVSQNWQDGVGGAFYIILAVIVVKLAIRTFNALAEWYVNRISAETASRIDDEVIPLIKKIFQIVAWIIAAIIVLDHFGISVSSLVVTLGAGSLALALAAQETLSNMIAGFVLYVDRPFRIGDRVLLENGTKGDVTEIGLRSTKVLTFESTIMVIPNSQIVKEKVTNLSYPDPKIRVAVEFGVAYGSDLDEVKRISLAVAGEHPRILKDPEPEVHFLEFGDSSLNLRLVGRTADYKEQWITAEEIRMGLWRAFRDNDIEIPFPQRDVWFRNRLAE
jgi:small-conductance mechanosensitive channel